MYCVTIKAKSTPIWNKKCFILPKNVAALAIFLLTITSKTIYAQPEPAERQVQMQAALYAEQEKAAPVQVSAGVWPRNKGRVYLSGGHNANHMHYKEYNEDRVLDENYGKTLGYYGSLGYRSGRSFTQYELAPFIEGYYRRFDGMNTYDGAIIGGGPFDCQQRAEVHRYGLKAGGYHNFSDKLEGFLYLDVGKRIWYRGENEMIRGVLMYAEKYSWVYVGFGTGVNYELLPKLTTGIEFEVMGAADAKMRADLYEGGTFRLGGVVGWEIKAPIKYYLLKNLSFDITPYLTFWNISESDPVLISGSYYIEPDSHTHIEGVLVGLTCIF